MKTHIYSVSVILLVCTSCATIFNRKETVLKIKSNEAAKVVFLQDTFEITENKKTALLTKRSNRKQGITFIYNDTTMSYAIKPIISNFSWFNFYTLGLGSIVDRCFNNGCEYPTTYFYNRKKINPPIHEQGSFFFDLSFPWFNQHHIEPSPYEQRNIWRYCGIGFGGGYYHSKNQFIDLNVSQTFGLWMPLLIPYINAESYELARSLNVSLTNNHQLGRFSLGYGLAFARFFWEKQETGHFADYEFSDIYNPYYHINYSRKYSTWGLNLNGYYRLSKHWHIGVIYRPTFLRTGITPAWKYEHMISIDFRIRFPFLSKKNSEYIKFFR